jgi:hypothetical protein
VTRVVLPFVAGVAALVVAGAVVANSVLGVNSIPRALPVLAAAAPPIYPLKVSANGRYLVDQSDAPFLMVGDSPQALIGNLSAQDVDLFLANRQKYGFNSVWVNLLCTDYTGCKADATTFDGVQPFTTRGDLSTPNEAYFSRVDQFINLAAKYGINVLLDPIETGGWLDILRSNGKEKAHGYGLYLGRRYRDVPNIVWVSGNDFQTWRDPNDDALVLAVANGIGDADPVHMQTVELDYYVSSSLDDANWSPLIKLEAAYTYQPTYAEILKDYGRPNSKPVFLVEANYEFEHDYSGPATLRRQEYWALLSGATGHVYGNKYTWRFAKDWKAHLDTSGSTQIAYATNFFASRRWYDLIPDQQHALVTAGYGVFSRTGNVNDSDYVAAAATLDGSLAIAYVPSDRTLTIDMSKFSGPVRGRWYDPSNDTYTALSDSLLENVGSRDLRTPGKNSDGDNDWVLVLEVTQQS